MFFFDAQFQVYNLRLKIRFWDVTYVNICEIIDYSRDDKVSKIVALSNS